MLLIAVIACMTSFSDAIKSNLGAQHIQYAKSQLDPNQYVTDGLVAWYDGEWNVGIGEHDPNATVWKDLSGNGNDLQIPYLQEIVFWENDCLRTASTRTSYIYAVADTAIQYETCEWIVEQIEYGGLVSFSGMGDYRFFAKDTNYVQFFAPYTETTIDGNIPYKGCFQCVYLGGSSINAFANGEQLHRIARQNSWQYARIQQNFGIGGGSRYKQWQMCGRIFAVRLYNRRLQQWELVHNYKIDKMRFGL